MSIYQSLARQCLKVFLILLVLFLGVLAFIYQGRVKGPSVAHELFNYMDSMTVSSSLLDSLDRSIVPNEPTSGWAQSSESSTPDFTFFRYSPKKQPLLDAKTLLPIEMTLVRNGEDVPFVAPDKTSNSSIAWTFIIDMVKRVSIIRAIDLFNPQEQIATMTYEGRPIDYLMLCSSNGRLRDSIETTSGLKRFTLRAFNNSNFSTRRGSAYTPRINIYIDGMLVGGCWVKSRDMTSYYFLANLKAGWHKFEIEFENAVPDIEKQEYPVVSIAGVDVSEISGSVYLIVRRGLEEVPLSSAFSLTYFSALPEENECRLIQFYKERFAETTLREVVEGGLTVKALVKDVEVGTLTRRALFAPAPTKIKLKVAVPIDGIRLVASFGMMQESWSRMGDGVEFRIRVDTKENEPEDVLFSKYINPKINPLDRKWFTAEADLKKFRGKSVPIIFETVGSAVTLARSMPDNSSDWAVWGQ